MIEDIVMAISPEVAHKKSGLGLVFVDLRELDDIARFSLDVAEQIAMPFSQFEERCAELPKERELLMICKGGGKSNWAAQQLLAQGYSQVANLEGGILKWVAKGLPTKGDMTSL